MAILRKNEHVHQLLEWFTGIINETPELFLKAGE
jgi:hypothetical protein